MNINWSSKLKSKVFWTAVTAFVVAILTTLGVNPVVIAQIVGVIVALSALVILLVRDTRSKRKPKKPPSGE
jgi:uncharacterized membrane protein